MPAPRRIVVHVGAHKTGTTAVQQCLKAHADELYRRHRVRYVPRTELVPLIGWGERLLSDPDGFARLVAGFRADRKARVLLASYENLCGPPFVAGRPGLYPKAPAHLDALRALLGDADVTVLLSVRPQHELIESYYLQHVNLGGTTPFARWLRTVDLGHLDWRPLVDRLCTTFGAGAVRVIDFRVIRQGSEAFVRHFLDQAGVAPGIPFDPIWTQPFNVSLSARGLDLALRMNQRLGDPRQRAVARSFLQRHFSHAAGGARPQLLDPALRAELAERYAGDYARLFERPSREAVPA